MKVELIKNKFYYQPYLWPYVPVADFVKIAELNIPRYDACIKLSEKYNISRLKILIVEYGERNILPVKSLDRWARDMYEINKCLPNIDSDYKDIEGITFNKYKIKMDFFMFLSTLIAGPMGLKVNKEEGFQHPTIKILRRIFRDEKTSQQLLFEIDEMDYIQFLIVNGLLKRINNDISSLEAPDHEASRIHLMQQMLFYADVYNYVRQRRKERNYLRDVNVWEKDEIEKYLRERNAASLAKPSLNTLLEVIKPLLKTQYLFALWDHGSLSNIYEVMQTYLFLKQREDSTSEALAPLPSLPPHYSFYTVHKLLYELFVKYPKGNDQVKSLITVELQEAIKEFAPELELAGTDGQTFENIFESFFTNKRKYGWDQDEIKKRERRVLNIENILERYSLIPEYRNFFQERLKDKRLDLQTYLKENGPHIKYRNNLLLARCYFQLMTLPTSLVKFTLPDYIKGETISSGLSKTIRNQKKTIWGYIKENLIDYTSDLPSFVEKQKAFKILDVVRKAQEDWSVSKAPSVQGSPLRARFEEQGPILSMQLEEAYARCKKWEQQFSKDYKKALKNIESSLEFLKTSQPSLRDFDTAIKSLYQEKSKSRKKSDLYIYKYNLKNDTKSVLFKLKNINITTLTYNTIRLTNFELLKEIALKFIPKVRVKELEALMKFMIFYRQLNPQIEEKLHKVILSRSNSILYKQIKKYVKWVNPKLNTSPAQPEIDVKKEETRFQNEKWEILLNDKELKDLLDSRKGKDMVAALTGDLFKHHDFEIDNIINLTIHRENEELSFMPAIDYWRKRFHEENDYRLTGELFSFFGILFKDIGEKDEGNKKNIFSLIVFIFWVLYSTKKLSLYSSSVAERKLKDTVEGFAPSVVMRSVVEKGFNYVDKLRVKLLPVCKNYKRFQIIWNDITFPQVEEIYQIPQKIVYLFRHASKELFTPEMTSVELYSDETFNIFMLELSGFVEKYTEYIERRFQKRIQKMEGADVPSNERPVSIDKIRESVEAEAQLELLNEQPLFLPEQGIFKVLEKTEPLRNVESLKVENKIFHKESEILQRLEDQPLMKKVHTLSNYLLDEHLKIMEASLDGTDFLRRGLKLKKYTIPLMSKDITRKIWLPSLYQNYNGESFTQVFIDYNKHRINKEDNPITKELLLNINAAIAVDSNVNLCGPKVPLSYLPTYKDCYNEPYILTHQQVTKIQSQAHQDAIRRKKEALKKRFSELEEILTKWNRLLPRRIKIYVYNPMVDEAYMVLCRIVETDTLTAAVTTENIYHIYEDIWNQIKLYIDRGEEMSRTQIKDIIYKILKDGFSTAKWRVPFHEIYNHNNSFDIVLHIYTKHSELCSSPDVKFIFETLIVVTSLLQHMNDNIYINWALPEIIEDDKLFFNLCEKAGYRKNDLTILSYPFHSNYDQKTLIEWMSYKRKVGLIPYSSKLKYYEIIARPIAQNKFTYLLQEVIKKNPGEKHAEIKKVVYDVLNKDPTKGLWLVLPLEQMSYPDGFFGKATIFAHLKELALYSSSEDLDNMGLSSPFRSKYALHLLMVIIIIHVGRTWKLNIHKLLANDLLTSSIVDSLVEEQNQGRNSNKDKFVE